MACLSLQRVQAHRGLDASPLNLPSSTPSPFSRNVNPFHRLEKLELLRQNVSCQHEVQRLRDREMQLQADLNTASREINRLRDGFVTSIMAAKSRDERIDRRTEATDKTFCRGFPRNFLRSIANILLLTYTRFIERRGTAPQAEESPRDCVRGDDQQQGPPIPTHQKEELSGRAGGRATGGRSRAEQAGLPGLFAPGRIAQEMAK